MTERRRRSGVHGLWGLLVLAGLLAWNLIGGATVGAQGTNNTFTTSTTHSETIHTTPVTVRQDTFTTRLSARLEGGPSVYDQTFPEPLTGPALQQAILDATAALAAAAQPQTTTVSGPTLLSSTTELVDTTIQGQETSRTDTETVEFQETIGPATICVGNGGGGHPVPPPCHPGTPFVVVVGTQNFNANTHTQTDIFVTETTTQTFETSASYELVGTASGSAGCAPPPAAPTVTQTLSAVPAAAGTLPLFAAVLPGSRSVKVGCPATAFVTLINAGADPAAGVGIGLQDFSLPVALVFQTTDPLTNALTGSANTAVTIGPGQAQSFIVALTPTAPFAARDVVFAFTGANTAPVTPFTGLNTLLLAASTSVPPDIVALGATLTGDGILNIPGPTATGFFVAATVNVGAGASLTASADTGGVVLPVTIAVCQTDPVTSACLAAPSATVPTQIAAGATPTFAVFVTGTANVSFDPAGHRVFLRFTDAGGATRGSTSVAVRTQ